MQRSPIAVVLVVGLGMLTACEQEPMAMLDAGRVDTAEPDARAPAPMRCGNFEVEGSEECDDGNRNADDGCSPSCELECGDGRVSGSELCDVGITDGEGACPLDCDDGDACTSDALDGADCAVTCSHGAITAPSHDDGCCPPGASASTDNDCPGTCGDGFATGSETCDTAIASGAGACPSSCDDLNACTRDTLEMDGTCQAVCTYSEITSPTDGDECCPAGANSSTDSDCSITCGDGVVSMGETCDTAITAGTIGACATSCPDLGVCTIEMLVAAGTCTAQCTSVAITIAMNGDGCCPAGATSATDDDCTGTCGDGTVSAGEACDIAITSGPGRCPTSCNDGLVCTEDMLIGAGSCAATCSHPPITAPMNGDLCCPTGATISTDSDCRARCGDGVVSTGENCDTAITTGAGACPAACDDGMACTRDMLVGSGCNALCTHPTITAAANNDGCCPMGATIGNDNDCSARCGDSVVTAPETCDDGNAMGGDGCSSTCTLEAMGPTAFRLTDLDLRDPHIFADVIFCTDVTNTAFGRPGFNPILQENIQADGDMPPDGLLDFSLAQVWRPLVQAASTSTSSDIVFPDCASSTSCALPAGAPRLMGTSMNLGAGAICLDAIPGTTRAGYMPAITYPTAPASGTCYVMNVGTLTFDFGGTEITLTDAVIAGEWFGNPATEIRDGLIRGFLSEAAANHTIIPDGVSDLAAIDCQPLGSLLPGGNPPPRTASDPAPPPGCADGRGAETPLDPPQSCATHDARDVGPGGVSGWYFYLNFTATRITAYTE